MYIYTEDVLVEAALELGKKSSVQIGKPQVSPE